MYKVSRRNEFVFAGDTLKNRKKRIARKIHRVLKNKNHCTFDFYKERSTILYSREIIKW